MSILTLHLVAPKARSRITGFYYFKKCKTGRDLITANHPILIKCRHHRHVVGSAVEEETAGIFHNAQNIILLRCILKVLGHPHAPTPIKTDNKTANTLMHSNMHLQRSKTWDMHHYWLCDNINLCDS